MNNSGIKLTVGELKEMLSHFSEDAEIDFGQTSCSHLEFRRMKSGGKTPVLIELS